MCIYSVFWNQWEKKNLAPYAVHSDHAWYSKRISDVDSDNEKDRSGSRSRYRTTFEIDKDRITNSQAFRRLEYKTQVFVTHEGDNFRTRLTHSLEVAEIARHIARSLRLNELLVEAIALGHDLGHAPYGHIAETAINEWIVQNSPELKDKYYFCHNRHSVENVEHLEPGYDWDNREEDKSENGFGQGLNLATAVREGILVHTSMGYRGLSHHDAIFDETYENAICNLSNANKKKGLFYPGSLEAQVVRIADDLAQRIHDLEDGLRSGMLEKQHVREVIKEFIAYFSNKMFGETPKLNTGEHLEFKEYGTQVSKAYLDDIISPGGIKRDVNYSEIDANNVKIKMIDEKFKTNEDYRVNFIRVAVVAFLLHMWRDAEYLSGQKQDDLVTSRSRIYKYYTVLKNTFYEEGKEMKSSAYHIIAFLRGVMQASVIEHSYYNIHRLLDKDFRMFNPKDIEAEKKEKWYLIFVVVNGFTWKTNNDTYYEPIEDENRRYCFEFNSENDRRKFVDEHFEKILSSNGYYLNDLKMNWNSGTYYTLSMLSRVSWLNKCEEPDKTEYVKLEFCGGITVANAEKGRWVPLEKVSIQFTGFMELCPGVKKGACNYAVRQEGKNCSSIDGCPFKSTIVSYPDITRLVEFQGHIAELDKRLRELIKVRIHSGSRIARMNYMGEKIIWELLDTYLKRPRIMHDRVWSRLRVYSERPIVSVSIYEWTEKSIVDREKEILPRNAFKDLIDESNTNRMSNRFSLIRRIIEHLAGMTDRFIANEYNRINQSGREVERQDETYFFS